ncbi:fibropellin-1-like isoform X2 [Anneissia japonica]|uniref:fibropellin-1-like isoform X2 n=1 Tax=Anneissia japonica TaxID=1529436 RepID=UPI0014256A90|nr:fibropellin-1-like isoform X2 [Anneissia japonica]
MFRLILLLTLIPVASGNSEGANTGACANLTPRHGSFSAQTSTSPWGIFVGGPSYTPGQPFSVTVQSTGSQQYKGLLLQARPVGTIAPVGTWTTNVADTQQMTCSNANDGITHSNNFLKPLTSTFIWLPPSTSVGSVQFHATFVESYSTFWVDVVSSVVTAGFCDSNPNPCQNNGVCVNTGNYYTCQCQSGFMGQTCDQGNTPTPCDSAPCQNGGVCMNVGTTSFVCSCPSTYTGTQCQTPISTSASCSPNPCSNGGVCSLSGNSYKCDCSLGTIGNNCETLVSSGCISNSCGTFGTCQTLSTGGYFCVCSNGYSGDTCNEPPTTYCGVGTCQQNAPCSLSGSYYQCDCPTGYTGQNCELTQSACSDSPCLNGAACNVVSSNAYSCTCTPGYGGLNCGEASNTYCLVFSPCSSTLQQCTLSGNWYRCV